MAAEEILKRYLAPSATPDGSDVEEDVDGESVAAPAAPDAAALGGWRIVRRELLPTTGCQAFGALIETPWIAVLGHRPYGRDAIVNGRSPAPAPAELVKLLDALNENLPSAGDDAPYVGWVDVGLPRCQDQRSCPVTNARFETFAEPLRRGSFDLCIGLGGGENPALLGHYASHVLAPSLATFADGYFDSDPPERLYTPVEQQAREEAERRAAAQALKQAKVDQALSELANMLFGSDTAETRQRASGVVAAIDSYRALTRG